MVLIGLAIIFSYSMGNVCAAGTTIYVNGLSGNEQCPNGLNATHISGTLSCLKLSIKNATSTVDTNLTVYIADGQYSGINNTQITIDQNMNIIGQNETDVIINGTGTNWIFAINSGVTLNLSDLTLRQRYYRI